MTLILPELKAPLGGVNACSNSISLSDHPDLDFPGQRIEELADLPDGIRMVRLLREPTATGHCHFHIDLVSKDVLKMNVTANTDLQSILSKFDSLVGRTLRVNFGSRFKFQLDEIPKSSIINLLSDVGLRIGGTTAAVNGASIRVSDSIISEIKWRIGKARDDTEPAYLVDIMGSYGEIILSDEVLVRASESATNALKKFVIPTKKPSETSTA